jgi:DNA-binding transcriptional MocR family regulator
MKLWISKSSEVPVAEQLTTQIMLAIHSGELKPNQKLPSTRELAADSRFTPTQSTRLIAISPAAAGFTLEKEVGCMCVPWPQTVHSTGTCSSIN